MPDVVESQREVLEVSGVESTGRCRVQDALEQGRSGGRACDVEFHAARRRCVKADQPDCDEDHAGQRRLPDWRYECGPVGDAAPPPKPTWLARARFL